MNFGNCLQKELEEIESNIKETKRKIAEIASAFEKCSIEDKSKLDLAIEGFCVASRLLTALYAQHDLITRLMDEA